MPRHISKDSALCRAGWLKIIQPMPSPLRATILSVSSRIASCLAAFAKPIFF